MRSRSIQGKVISDMQSKIDGYCIKTGRTTSNTQAHVPVLRQTVGAQLDITLRILKAKTTFQKLKNEF